MTNSLVAIIGAGPAGLLLARLLDLSGISYTIFERDESPNKRIGSGTLDVHPKTGQLALQEAGLLDQFNALARHGVDTTIVDSEAKVLVQLGGKGDKERPEIDRRDLQRILHGSIPHDNIQWGSKIHEVSKGSEGLVDIHMADGRVESGFRLVVGADGAWSKVRNLLTSAKPQYSGTTFFTTYVKPGDAAYDAVDSLVKQNNFLAMGGRQKIFIYYLGDQSYFLSVGLGLPAERLSDKATIKDGSTLWQSLLHDQFSAWTLTLTDLIKQSEGEFRAWPLYNLPSEALSWNSVPGATLIGDAAHLTVPTGEGVNIAMFDGLELAQQITKYGVDNLDQAVVEYEKLMMPRAVQAIQKAQWATEKLFGPEAPYSFLTAIGMEVKDQS